MRSNGDLKINELADSLSQDDMQNSAPNVEPHAIHSNYYPTNTG